MIETSWQSLGLQHLPMTDEIPTRRDNFWAGIDQEAEGSQSLPATWMSFDAA